MKAKTRLARLFLCVLLSLSLVFSMTACGVKDSTSDSTSDSTTDSTTEPPAPTYSVEITNEGELSIYETKTLQLTTVFSPVDASIVWTSSDPLVATVSEEGLVTGMGAGEATIKAAINEEAYDEVTVKVKGAVINNAVNTGHFDVTNLYQDNAVIKTADEYGNAFNSFAAFSGTAGKYYVATAKAKLTNPQTEDTWSRVGVSHWNTAANSYYGLQLSAGPDFGARKTVTMVITNGEVQWGYLTDRSQVWGQHGLAGIDFNAATLTTVRAGNDFYSYINGELYYYDAGVEGFNDVDTLPILNVGSCQAEFSEMKVEYGQEAVEAFLNTADASKFYASYADTIIGKDGSIQFTGAAAGTCSNNAKDHAAKSIGAMAILDANVQGTVEFDLTINGTGDDPLPALAVTINRYDGGYAEARSLVVGLEKAGWTGWNSNGNLNDGIGDDGRTYSLNGETARLEVGQTYHVVFTRLMNADGQDTQLRITDKDGNVLLEYAHGWRDGYKGRASVSFLCRDLDCTLANIVISSEQHAEQPAA